MTGWDAGVLGALLGNGWLLLFARLGMGALFLAAGWRKRHEPEAAAALLDDLRLARSRAARAALRALPGIEMTCGFLLLMGLLTPWAAAASSLLLLLFAGVVAVTLRRGQRLDFRCAPGLACRASGWMVARNLGLAALAFALVAGAPDSASLDHLLLGQAARPLSPWEVVPAAGLALFVLAAGQLLPAMLSLAGRMRRPQEA